MNAPVRRTLGWMRRRKILTALVGFVLLWLVPSVPFQLECYPPETETAHRFGIMNSRMTAEHVRDRVYKDRIASSDKPEHDWAHDIGGPVVQTFGVILVPFFAHDFDEDDQMFMATSMATLYSNDAPDTEMARLKRAWEYSTPPGETEAERRRNHCRLLEAIVAYGDEHGLR